MWGKKMRKKECHLVLAAYSPIFLPTIFLPEIFACRSPEGRQKDVGQEDEDEGNAAWCWRPIPEMFCLIFCGH
jgi:hypothetical protein